MFYFVCIFFLIFILMIVVNVCFEMVFVISVGYVFCYLRGRWEDVDNKWKDVYVVVFWCIKM